MNHGGLREAVKQKEAQDKRPRTSHVKEKSRNVILTKFMNIQSKLDAQLNGWYIHPLHRGHEFESWVKFAKRVSSPLKRPEPLILHRILLTITLEVPASCSFHPSVSPFFAAAPSSAAAPWWGWNPPGHRRSSPSLFVTTDSGGARTSILAANARRKERDRSIDGEVEWRRWRMGEQASGSSYRSPTARIGGDFREASSYAEDPWLLGLGSFPSNNQRGSPKRKSENYSIIPLPSKNQKKNPPAWTLRPFL
ncbi:hypothetical protein VNO77_19180 [Canavalia gladiata]|uniref:Uncharacterized protein n=1 Tax=Canavalia gladiata TaxID=3824 RepID=A0AAN9LM12_CANGL